MEEDRNISFEVESQWIFDGEHRLNASSFSPEAAKSLLLIDNLRNKGIDISKVENYVTEIFYPGRFKRIYSKEGKTFLSSKDIFDFRFEGKKIKNASEKYMIKPGYLLVTRSGSVGRVLAANSLLSECAISEHVIRVIPKGDLNLGFIYFYLLSEIGQPLIKKNIFGGVVDEIEPHHIAELPFPKVKELEVKLNRKMKDIFRLREEAQEDLSKAINMIYSELELKKLSENDVSYYGIEDGENLKSFIIKSNDLEGRLDASFHVPLAHFVVEQLQKSKSGKVTKLGDISETFVPPRFKRAYVENPVEGVPLLQGSHIPQIKPQDVKYLWNKMKNLERYTIKKNWILVTCSGTIGRLSLIRDYWKKWSATNHLLRIIPDENEIHPGYLTAFLLSNYGNVLFQRLIYGGVVDEIGEAGELFNEIPILKPNDYEIEERIGDLIYKAYDKRDKANQIEDKYINLLEKELRKLAEN